MSVSSTINRNTYQGNGAVSVYDYQFRIFTESDLLLIVREINTNVETPLVLATDYTVSGVKDLDGGQITLVDNGQAWISGGNLSADYRLDIRRVVELTQETDIRNQGDFFPEVHEDTFDKSRFIDQQQQDEIDRSVKLPETVTQDDFDPTLPTDIQTANTVVIVNETADGYRMGPTANEIENAQGYAIDAANSAAAALVSENNAAVSESNAAQSATDAANAASASQWTDVSFVGFASSPITILESDSGTLFNVDTSGGPVVFNLPEISSLNLTNPWSIGIKKTTSDSNDITVNPFGGDQIDGGSSSVISRHNAGKTYLPDADPAPDQWTSISFGEVPITGAIVGTTDVQTLTNKTFDDAISIQEIATPSTPLTNYQKIYPKSDGELYTLDDAGLERPLRTSNPTGTVITSFATSSPPGYLYCDGSAVSRATYATLFATIGTSCGEGDGSTTFNLPDLRGQFLRGQDDGRGLDSAAGSRTAQFPGGNIGDNVGSAQQEFSGFHAHTVYVNQGPSNPGGVFTDSGAFNPLNGATSILGGTRLGVSSSNYVGESLGSSGPNHYGLNGSQRPTNVSVRYYIKT